MLQRLRSLFRVLTRRRDFEEGMSAELRFHIEQYTDDLMTFWTQKEAQEWADTWNDTDQLGSV
jgi:hypothetical protein